MTVRSLAGIRPRRLSVVIPAMFAIAWCGFSRADDISLIPGSTFKSLTGRIIKGQIQSESPTEVVIVLGENTTKVPVDQIASIRYDGQSATFQLAEARESSSQFAEAAELFKKAATESAGKPFPQQAALFREAEVLTDLALIEPERIKDAKDKLAKFTQSYPTSRHITGARSCLAKLQLASNDFAGAEATIAELTKNPRTAQQGAILHTRVLAKQGKYADAVEELDTLIAAYPKGSERQRDAMLSKAESLAGLKKYKEAEALVREVIKANPAEDAAAQAPAYNTLGDCLRAAEKPKDALLAYLHTDLLYSKDKEEHPRALYQIAAMFRALKQDGRADEFAQRLRQEYPRSSWAAGRATQ